MLRKKLVIFLLILMIGTVCMSSTYAFFPILQVIVQDVGQGALYLIQSQPLWIQVVVGIFLVTQLFGALDFVVSIVLTSERSLSKRFQWLAIGAVLSILFLFLFIPLLIGQLKLIVRLLPILLIGCGLEAAWLCYRKFLKLYQQWRLSQSIKTLTNKIKRRRFRKF